MNRVEYIMNLVLLDLLKQREISSCMLHLNFTTNIWEDGVTAISFINIDEIHSISPQKSFIRQEIFSYPFCYSLHVSLLILCIQMPT